MTFHSTGPDDIVFRATNDDCQCESGVLVLYYIPYTKLNELNSQYNMPMRNGAYCLSYRLTKALNHVHVQYKVFIFCDQRRNLDYSGLQHQQ